jgi:probable rRNA maturation factor
LEIGLRNAQRRERVDLPSLRRFLERLVELEPPGEADALAVLFVSDHAMRGYNRRFRGKDRATDVLSFPDGEERDPDGGRHLGDILISVDTARHQARAAGHPLGKEMRILLIHGYLHLLGYDHEVDGGVMRRRERRLAARLLA